MITTVCKISYSSQTVPPIVPAVQGDTGRAISFEIADFTPPAGATATYFILKPSGEAVYNSATITDNSILCELTAQSLAEKGENRMQVRVLQGDDIVTSFEVILMVRPFLGDDAIESGTEMDIFDQAVAQATEQFQENAEQIVEEVIESIPADYTELTEEVDELNERLGIAENKIDDIVPGLTDVAKTALINCFANVSWNNNGKVYYDALVAALYDSYPRISATYDPGVNVIYTDDTLDTLKQYITVKYYATSESEGVVIGSNSYTLSGTLAEGTNNITVTYDGLTATVIVPDVINFYNIWEWDSRFTGAGKLTRTPVRAGEFTYEGVSRKGILYNTSLISGNNNRGFATLRGKAPMVTEDNVTLSNYYPIPIPATATKLIATITPNTQRLSPVLFQYDPTNQTPAPYSRIGSIVWYVGTQTITFTASENLFLAFNCSIDAAFTQYTPETEPEMNVVFE